MDVTQKELNKLIDSGNFVVRLNNESIPPIKERLEALLASVNNEIPNERQVMKGELLEVAKRSFSKHLLTPNREQLEFKVFREVSNFLEMAISGTRKELASSHTDLLSPGHPLSTSAELESLEEEEIRELKAQWLANDPRISEEFRPVVASGFMSTPDSVERRFIVTRLENLDSSLVPKDVVLSISDHK
jgi:phage terminase small subunit